MLGRFLTVPGIRTSGRPRGSQIHQSLVQRGGRNVAGLQPLLPVKLNRGKI